ncbi:MAG: hypothetical protein JSU85_05670, partial [Candidatus Zixiibacteriota bacterium]
MKKFLSLCLLLIVVLVWMVSVASDLDRNPAAGSSENIAIAKQPKAAIERPASANRMKDIKADGVIDASERAEYERLLSLAPSVELPVPLNIVSEVEPNNTCETGNLIACGDTVWCATLTAHQDDDDWYTFTLASDQQVIIQTHPTGTACQEASMTDTYLELYEADCTTLIAYNDDINNPANYFSKITVNLSAGTYAIDNSHGWDSAGSYHLSLLCGDIPPVWACWGAPPDTIAPDGKIAGGNIDIEPNNTCVVAREALCEYAYCGDLSSNIDEDWYYVDLPADTTYALHVRVFGNDTPNQYAQGGECDPYVALYRADCTSLVVENEDYFGTFPDAEVYDSQIDPGGDNCFQPGERVYIRILTRYQGPGPYLLIINCEPCEMVEPVWSCVDDPPYFVPPDGKQPGGMGDIEPNDTCQEAVEALCEYAYCGDISTDADVDWYYIDLPADTSYGVHVRVFGNDTPNQYAQGGGLDPWVGLYKSDCVTLVARNEDYGGTFPDAEVFDSQIDPGGANCFPGGTRVYIKIKTDYDSPGPYLLIINCEPGEMPDGACCVDMQCMATNNWFECDAFQGTWYINQDCETFLGCPPPASCDERVVYNNGDFLEDFGRHTDVPTSHCASDVRYTASAVDDITLSTDVQVSTVIAWTTHFPEENLGSPADYLGINITFYRDDLSYPGRPGGKPDITDCGHTETVAGGIYHTEFIPFGLFRFENVSPGICVDEYWRLEIPLDTAITLFADTLYWLEIQPVLNWVNGEVAIFLSQLNTGAGAMQIEIPGGIPDWTPIDGSPGVCQPDTGGYTDLAFCLLGESAGGCDYAVGDVNGSGNYNGLDITFGVAYFKGGNEPMCPDCPPCNSWNYCGDVNGSCNYNGLDITYGVAYFKGG